jgi:putative membrane protein
VGVLFIAFVSPLCAATVALFSARAVHHVLLVVVAAPLLALAGSGRDVRPASPLGLPLLLATGVFYSWHLPPLYDTALESTAVYWLMQATLLGSATWFWASALSVRTAPATALLAMVASAALMGLLGALLTFAPQPLYAAHLITTAAFGLTPLEDQQLAGLVMWVPALLPYLVLAGIAARRWSRAWARAEA